MEKIRDNKLYLSRFSIMLAFLALGFSLIYLIPERLSPGNVHLFIFTFQFNFLSLIPFILALVAAVGAVWVFVAHPRWESEPAGLMKLFPHITLPFIASLILGIVLSQSARSLIWWIVLSLGYLIVFLLLRSEYVLLGQEDASLIQYNLIVISFSYGMFLVFATAIKNSSLRMFLQMTLIFAAAFFVTFRTMTIWQRKDYKMTQSLIISLLISELAVGLHYLFINPLQYGLILTGGLYSLTSWFNLYEENKKWHQYMEPLIMLVVTTLIVILGSIL